ESRIGPQLGPQSGILIQWRRNLTRSVVGWNEDHAEVELIGQGPQAPELRGTERNLSVRRRLRRVGLKMKIVRQAVARIVALAFNEVITSMVKHGRNLQPAGFVIGAKPASRP